MINSIGVIPDNLTYSFDSTYVIDDDVRDDMDEAIIDHSTAVSGSVEESILEKSKFDGVSELLYEPNRLPMWESISMNIIAMIRDIYDSDI